MIAPYVRDITGTIISMGHSLKIKVAAEGVETEEQLALLKSQGCDEVQGYYYSKPWPPEKLVGYLASRIFP